jgi:hypothetical protein
MLSAMMDAGLASRRVGHVSASQFSRECGRFLGSTPTKDIARLREQVGGVLLNSGCGAPGVPRGSTAARAAVPSAIARITPSARSWAIRRPAASRAEHALIDWAKLR